MEQKIKDIDRLKKMGYSVINLSTQIPSYPTFSKSAKGWINYGRDNNLPQQIIELNNLSAVNKSIIDSKVTYICGSGTNKDNYYGRPNPNEDWDIFIEKISRDYATFGGFCFQVITNEDGKNLSLYHTDFSKIRVGEVNEYGIAQNYYLSNDWKKTTGQYAPILIDAYGCPNQVQGKPCLFYYKDYEPSLDYYPVPQYYSALNYIEADGLLGKFYRNSINNGFAPSVIVTIPSNPSDEAKAQFNRDMTNTFAGTNGANSIVVLYGESQEIKPTVTPFVASGNADLYNNVNDVVFQKIISAHRLSSPTLAGLSGSGNLSGNASEIINAFILYNYTVIHNMRRKITETLNPFVINNGYPKLVINELEVINEIKKYEGTYNEQK
ncbi:phage portal protein [Dysgonomonas sp. 216]|uniref:phage portal protein n=1 Tax=Dysgonomonas sp. 216 TaxID=2302934 RepID=UPI0013D40003|nr:phage portal protein [Dysgonomonas sp. 216]NDW19095.1 phage portal protein [Dysgonomonas sp. 216]